MDEQPDPPPPPEPRRARLTPLTAALLVPALALALLASLWVGAHARGDRTPTATTSPEATTPAPTSWPLAWPAEDGGSLDPNVAYGRLAIQASLPTLRYTVSLAPGASVPPPGRTDPRLGTVQRVGPLDDRIVGAVAERLGTQAGTIVQGSLSTWPDIHLQYDASTSTFQGQPDAHDGALPAVPRDDDTAARAARDWLLRRGLVEPLAPVVATQVSRGDLAAFPTWQVTVPHLAGQSDVTEITMGVSASGLVGSITIVHPVVLGTSTYPVVGWETAWAQVQAGRARDATLPGDGSVPPSLHVDLVQVTARMVTTTGGQYVVPAYSFTDSASHTTLYWPALDPAQYTLP